MRVRVCAFLLASLYDWSFDLCTVRSLVKGPEPCKIGVMHAKKVKPPQEMEIKIAAGGSYALKIRGAEPDALCSY